MAFKLVDLICNEELHLHLYVVGSNFKEGLGGILGSPFKASKTLGAEISHYLASSSAGILGRA